MSDPSKKLYIVMNKPVGVVCSSVSDSHKTVYDLLTPELQMLLKAKRGQRLHTVGRLDSLTSGLLLITNDGEFSNFLTRPQNKIKKTYVAVLEKSVDDKTQQDYKLAFLNGVILPAEKKAPEQFASGAEVEFLSQTVAKITVTEGKFHEVRRLFKAVGNEVLELNRVSMDVFDLKDFNFVPGQWISFDLEKDYPNCSFLTSVT